MKIKLVKKIQLVTVNILELNIKKNSESKQSKIPKAYITKTSCILYK